MLPADRRRQAIAEVQIGDESLAARRKEAALAQPQLEPLEGAFCHVELDRIAIVYHARLPRIGPIAIAPPAPATHLDTTFITLSSV